jgi:RimJ/RimL family protein N-acetyltransferase
MIKYVKALPREKDLAILIKDAFASEPWLEDLSDEECESRADSYLRKKNVRSISAYNSSELVGVVLVDELSLSNLENERGGALKEWVICKNKNAEKVLWGRETLIKRGFQSQGIGKDLRKKMISYICEDTNNFWILLTRMRDDNSRVIKIAEHFGYERIGVRVKSSMGENVWHEYWFKTFALK